LEAESLREGKMRLYNISVNNLWRRKAKMIFLVIGLVIGIMTVVTLTTVTNIMNKDIAQKFDEYGANILVMPQSDDLSLAYGGIAVSSVSIEVKELEEGDIAKIKSIKNKENLSVIAPKLMGVVQLQQRNILLVGVNFPEELRLKKWWKIMGKEPEEERDILLGKEVAAKLAKMSGSALNINGETFRVAGVLEETGSQDDDLIFASLPVVQKMFGKEGKLSLIEVSAFCNTCPIEEMVRQMSAKLPNAKVTAIKQVMQQKMEMTNQFKNFSLGVSLIVLLIGSLIVFTTMMASINERAREIGIFRAIGFRKRHIMKIVLLEAFLVSTIGGFIGYILGIGAAKFVVPMVAKIKDTEVLWDFKLLALAVTIAVFVGITASIYPSVKAANEDPTQALRAI